MLQSDHNYAVTTSGTSLLNIPYQVLEDFITSKRNAVFLLLEAHTKGTAFKAAPLS